MTQKKNILNDIDIEGIVKNSIKSNRLLSSVNELNEAYVAQVKPFKQVTEYVSQKTKESHTALYKGYVEALNKVSSKLDSADKPDANSNHSAYRSLKLDEAYNLNSVWLHELYFANCFDPHSEILMDTTSYLKIQRDFGTFEDWQRDFIACAMSARNGWAVTGYHMFLKRYMNIFVSGHSCDIPLGFYPIIVVDMWEHAYSRDYLNDKKSYLITQMRELNWTVIEERFAKAENIAAAVK